MATAALVLAIVGLALAFVPFAFVVSAPLALVAVVLGVFALRSAIALGTPRGKPTAALIVGALGLVASALMYSACIACHRECGDAGNYSLTHHCWNDGDCRTWSSSAPFCVGGQCATCRTDRDCTGSDRKRCAGRVCVECVGDRDCRGALPFCVGDHQCAACRADADCKDPARAFCTDGHECGVCRADSDCKDARRPRCLNGVWCVRCNLDEHCPTGQVCVRDEDAPDKSRCERAPATQP